MKPTILLLAARDLVAQLAKLSVSLDAEAGEGTDDGSVGPGAVAKPVWTDELDTKLRLLVYRNNFDFREVARGLAPAIVVTPKECYQRFAGLESEVGGAGVEGTGADSGEDRGVGSSSTAPRAIPPKPAPATAAPVAALADGGGYNEAGRATATAASAPADSPQPCWPAPNPVGESAQKSAQGKRAAASSRTETDGAEAKRRTKKHASGAGPDGAGVGKTGTGKDAGDVGMVRTPASEQAAAGGGHGGAGAALESGDVIASLRRMMASLSTWVEKLSK
jgi:hypothetical protein